MSTKENKALVSVIVPAYNVERYIRECIQSITDQTYSNLEIIIVDDGSTDSTGTICDSLADHDNRITVIHKPNSGLSDARNMGIAHSHGEWIAFIDSDDFVAATFIETLIKAAYSNKCEIAAIPFGRPFKDGETCILNPVDNTRSISIETAHEVQEKMLYQAYDTASQWRICKSDIVNKHTFPSGMYYEDLAIVYKYIHDANRIAIVNDAELYAYRLRSNSIIRQRYNHLKSKSALTIGPQLVLDIQKWYPDLRNAAESRIFSLYRMVFAQIPFNSSTPQEKSDQAQLWIGLKSYRSTVLHDPHARRRERLAAAIASLGKTPFSIFCLLCRKFGLMQ